MTSSMTCCSSRYRRRVCIQMESRGMLREERHRGQGERIEYTKTHLWYCTSLQVSCTLLSPSTWAYNRVIVSHTSTISLFDSNSLRSYMNMWTSWVRNEQIPRPLWRRTCTSYWETWHMANSWRTGWNEWKWSLPTLGINAMPSFRNMDMT